MLKIFFKVLYFSSLLLITSCQPLETTPSTHPSDGDSTFPDRNQKEYEDRFLSDKLDLVFVLDTHPDMKSFYQENLFGSNFLSRFEKYDWRFAYTDMSVDTNTFLNQEEEKKEKEEEVEEESCDYLLGLLMTGAGLATGGPMLSAFGLRNLFDCLSNKSIFSDDEENTEKSFTNGAFLPLEHKGEKLSYNGLNYMPKSVANYNEIFNHTVTLGNKREDDYEAPEIKDQEAYPFLSTIFSLANGSSPLKTDSHSETLPFFRDNSSIVYVLITTHDMQVEITAKQFQQSLQSFFKDEKRVRIIPVTLSSDFSYICQLRIQKTSSSHSPKLRRLASQLNNEPLDICSRDLADKLFKEITKSVYSTAVLDD